MQVKLLRVLEERKVLRVGGRRRAPIDVRFIAATNRDLERRGRTRALPPGPLLPAQRHHAHDPAAARAHRRDRAARARVPRARAAARSQRAPAGVSSDAALALLRAYPWPGNIRELRNVIERAVLLCDGDDDRPEHLPPKMPRRRPRRARRRTPSASARRELTARQIEAVERGASSRRSSACGGNQTHAAELLGISRRTLVTRLAEYGLPRPRKR